jgi:hypothetical protein
MRVRLGGISTVLVAVATATCGVLMLGGVGPAPAGAGLTGDVLPAVVPVTSAPATSDPADDPVPSSTTTVASSSSSTSTTLAETTTTTTLTITPTTLPTTTVPVEPASPVPLSVSASQGVVGAGGTVDFAGTCASIDGASPGSLVVWVISDSTERVATGVTAVDWTYRWVAPSDLNEIASFTFQFWCGDPSDWQGGYPAELQRTVDMVAQAGPPPSTTTPLIEADPPSVIPETD